MTSLPTDASRWQQVKRVLERALELPPDEQQSFLERACVDSPSLRRDVDSLLAHADPDDTLRRGVARVAAETLALRESIDLIGRRLGPWRIREKIGQGGMGAVYLAERDDGAFSKRVAVKVVRAQVADDSGLRRFYTEREILASIEHPHIARLIDAGATDDGLPYLVMEYVEGDPIDVYCDNRRLDVDQRLGLFRQVCDAVQSAHDRQIVHRDLKPSNVLITGGGTPKLLDFGIAKLLAPDMLDRSVEVTSEFQRLMTPAYCSPEQIRGETVTPASDVYSLGVILYGLLCGHSPYEVETGAAQATEKIVCEVEPLPPSQALRRFDQMTGPDGEPVALTPDAVAEARGTDFATLFARLETDLDAIVLKALAKRPADRYGCARELGDALGRCAGKQASVIASSPPTAIPTAAEPPRAREAAAEPATLFEWGPLEVLRKVGEGMFGRVYECRDPSLQRRVALKLFHPPRGGDRALGAEVANRVLREGQLMARVRHGNVLTVFGVAVHEETVGMWMEFIDGKNLAEILADQGRFGPKEVCLIGVDLCAALAAVHGQGLVHRDIKAQNVIREEGGRYVLTDFGSGGDLLGPVPLQGEGAVGTPLYMAPEVLRGGVATSRSDIYSLGVLLFRLVTGEFPVESKSWAKLIDKHERGEHLLTREARPDVPPRLAHVLDKALSPQPEDRFDSAAAMLRALEVASDMSSERAEVVRVEEHTGPRPELPDRALQRVERVLTALAVGAAGLATLFLLGMVTSTAYRQALRIPPSFWTESPLSLPGRGVNVMVPLVVAMVAWMVLIGGVLSVGALLLWFVDRGVPRLDLRGKARQVVTRLRRAVERSSPDLSHALLLAGGVIAVAAATYWYRDLFGAVMALSDAQASRAVDATLLSDAPGANARSLTLTGTFAGIILASCAGLFALAAFHEKEARERTVVKALRAAVVGVVLYAAVVAAIPWRLVWDNHHERILVDGETAFVIAENDDQAWLYYPHDNRAEMLDLSAPGRTVERNQPMQYNVFSSTPER